jgi:DNA-binding transcriptional ArsR family regulator
VLEDGVDDSGDLADAGGRRATAVSQPLYQMKAEFFKTLGHPVRIRVLELLSEREHAVSELLAAVEIEPANLSQHLAVLRRAGLVTTRKHGSAVHYSVTSPRVTELLAVARAILTGLLSGQIELLHDLRTTVSPVHPAPEDVADAPTIPSIGKAPERPFR